MSKYLLNSFLLTALFIITSVNISFAQEEEAEEPKLTFSGSVDTYFRANFNGPNDPSEFGIVAPNTAFANTPGFSLGCLLYTSPSPRD